MKIPYLYFLENLEKMESISVTKTFPVTAERLYKAWLSSEEHSQFTVAPATIDPKVGGEFLAWDGYISGKNLVLEPYCRIVQSWRTTDFPENAVDSQIEVLLIDTEEGAILTINHSKIPNGQGKEYEDGWNQFYFQAMDDYFSR